MSRAKREVVEGHYVSVVTNVKEQDRAFASTVLIFSTECGEGEQVKKQDAVQVVGRRRHEQLCAWL